MIDNRTGGRVILSCTTTSRRQEMLYYVLQSLKRQTRAPDRVVINLSHEPYLRDAGMRAAAEWMTEPPFEVQWVKNIGPYRKLLPLFSECGEKDRVVTFDDDVLYHRDWLANLLELEQRSPDAIVCGEARYMKRGVFGRWQNYSRWDRVKQFEKGRALLPIGCGGIVYKKGLLDSGFLLDESFLRIAPTTDDLWFRMASLLRNVDVAVDPGTDALNIRLNHSWGLELHNRLNGNIGYVQRVYERTLGEIMDRLGVDRYPNDKGWSRIVAHVENNYGADFRELGL